MGDVFNFDTVRPDPTWMRTTGDDGCWVVEAISPAGDTCVWAHSRRLKTLEEAKTWLMKTAA